MKKIKKIQAMLLATAIIISLLASLPLVAGAAQVNVDSAKALTDALIKRDKSIVVNLTDSFSTGNSMHFDKKDITINLNGHDLSLFEVHDTAVLLENGAKLTINGPGTFNIISRKTGITVRGSSAFTATGGATVDITAAAFGISVRNSGRVYLTGSILSANKEVRINDESFSIDSPTKSGVEISGIIWDEYANGRAAVYIRQEPSVQGEWQKISGKWYYIVAGSGDKLTGWLRDGGKWYWLKSNGVMAANESLTIGGKTFKFSSSGECLNPYQ